MSEELWRVLQTLAVLDWKRYDGTTYALATVSIESAIRSRDGRENLIPSVPIEIPSLTPIVLYLNPSIPNPSTDSLIYTNTARETQIDTDWLRLVFAFSVMLFARKRNFGDHQNIANWFALTPRLFAAVQLEAKSDIDSIVSKRVGFASEGRERWTSKSWQNFAAIIISVKCQGKWPMTWIHPPSLGKCGMSNFPHYVFDLIRPNKCENIFSNRVTRMGAGRSHGITP